MKSLFALLLIVINTIFAVAVIKPILGHVGSYAWSFAGGCFIGWYLDDMWNFITNN